MGKTMTLNQLEIGQSGRVTHVNGTGAIRRRLLDLGIHTGEEIRLVRRAPLKDPIEISLGNGHISIRRSEAELIELELI